MTEKEPVFNHESGRIFESIGMTELDEKRLDKKMDNFNDQIQGLANSRSRVIEEIYNTFNKIELAYMFFMSNLKINRMNDVFKKFIKDKLDEL